MLLLLASPAHAVDLPETLTYRLSWLGVHIGTSIVTTRENGPCLETVATVESAAWTAPFYQVGNREVSCLRQAGDGLVEGFYHKQLREGPLRVNRTFTYDPAAGVLTQINHLTGEKQQQPVSGDAVDPVASSYLMRLKPLATGDVVYFQLIDNDTPNPVAIRVLRQEPVTVQAGTFQSLVLETDSTLDSEGLYYARGTLTVWLDTASRRPLRIDRRIPGLFAQGIPAWLRPMVPDDMLHSPKLETVRAELQTSESGKR